MVTWRKPPCYMAAWRTAMVAFACIVYTDATKLLPKDVHEKSRCSVNTLGWWDMVHLFVQRLVDHSSVFQDDLGILHVSFVQPRQRVLHPVLVVTVWEALMGMGSTRLLASLCRIHLLSCLVDQVF